MTDLEEVPGLSYPMPRLPESHLPIPSRQHLVKPSPYPLKHSGERQKGKTRFGVIHMSEGASALSSLKHLSENTTSSYHYIIERNGIIYRGVAHHLIAHHAGDSRYPGSDGNTLNDESVGVSLANLNGLNGKHEPVAHEQYLSLIWLTAFLTSTYDELFAEQWVGHRDIAPSRRRDPDPLVFSLQVFRCDLVEEMNRLRRFKAA